ncbi:uncharacterized protein LOC130987981 [Salvia miltiorrhiza]|uniref:uncharacterized protein LOC130987981 n=1 Tax=Salvia miltiorrhiza TaxID=226208 RepID=UPI0025ABBBB4|nr:uncharacterized protein LOC130987981 [Salvia miltiorrhiza]
MNAALDSPLEALAFNYLTYGFLTAVNNIWAWIAVVTAAVSFWRIRVLSSSTTDPSSRSHDAAASTASARVAESVAAEPASAPARAACVVLERQGSTKMKFSLYYKEEEEVDLRGDDDDEGGENEECGGGAAEAASLGVDAWRGDWEAVVALRMGDMGWYRWQDRTVLNGNVVRLWEGRKRKQTAALVVDGGVAW